MKRVARLLVMCALLGSVSIVTFADGNGGITQTPPAPQQSVDGECSVTSGTVDVAVSQQLNQTLQNDILNAAIESIVNLVTLAA
jgi:hypothetical protein